MKETPPVLTAGTAAWIRDQGRKRSRLLGTRPSLAAGGRGGPPGPEPPESTRGVRFRARPSRSSEKAGCLSAWRLRPRKPAAAQGPTAGLGSRGPLPAHGGGLGEGGQGPRGVAPEPPKASGAAELQRLRYAGLHPQPQVAFVRPTKAHKMGMNIRSHLSGREADCAPFGDTRIPRWSQPHPAAPLKPRPA